MLMELHQDMSMQEIREAAREIYEKVGEDGIEDLVDALESVTECPEGICDGSGKVETLTTDSDGCSIPDGEGDCICQLDI